MTVFLAGNEWPRVIVGGLHLYWRLYCHLLVLLVEYTVDFRKREFQGILWIEVANKRNLDSIALRFVRFHNFIVLKVFKINSSRDSGFDISMLNFVGKLEMSLFFSVYLFVNEFICQALTCTRFIRVRSIFYGCYLGVILGRGLITNQIVERSFLNFVELECHKGSIKISDEEVVVYFFCEQCQHMRTRNCLFKIMLLSTWSIGVTTWYKNTGESAPLCIAFVLSIKIGGKKFFDVANTLLVIKIYCFTFSRKNKYMRRPGAYSAIVLMFSKSSPVVDPIKKSDGVIIY